MVKDIPLRLRHTFQLVFGVGITGIPLIDFSLGNRCLQNFIVSFLGLAFSPEQKRIARLPSESGKPAVFIEKVPEGHAGDICLSRLLCIQIDLEEFPVSESQIVHRAFRRIGIVYVELRDMDLKPELSVHLKCGAVGFVIGMIHEQVGLKAHSVDKSLIHKRLKDICYDEIPLPIL